MTQQNIRSATPAGRLARICLAVPDPEATIDFLTRGLLLEVGEYDGRTIVTCDGDYHAAGGQGAVELVAAGDHGVKVERVVLSLPADADLDEVARLVGGVRASDTAVEVVDEHSVTVTLQQSSTLDVPAPKYTAMRPRRMGHVNLTSAKPARTAAFFTEVLGLRLSEYIGQDLYWMRTDTEHHNVALRPGTARSIHHLGFEIAGWHVYQPFLDHLDAEGFKIEYGPGRHRPGRSLFVYIRDPSSGLRVELFADMVHIDDPEAAPIGWEPGDRMTKTLNTWGPAPPPSFLE